MKFLKRFVPVFFAVLFAAGVAAAGGPIRVSSDFDSGGMGEWHLLDYNHLVCYPRVDYDRSAARSTTLWFYGRLENVLYREITIQFKGMQASRNFKPGKVIPYSRGAVHVFSDDNEHWQRFSNYAYEASTNTYTIKQIFSSDTVWIAYIEPYTWSRLETFIDRIEPHRSVAVESPGKTVQGRDIRLITISEDFSGAGERPVAWIIARQHPWETAGSWAVEGMIDYLLSDEPGAVEIRRGVTFKIIPMANPDGVYNGVTRFNAGGIDLNRHWNAGDPLSADTENAPEIALVKRAIAGWCAAGRRFDFFLNIHNNAMCWNEGGAYIHFAPESKERRAAEFARYLAEETVFDGPVERPGRENATEKVVAAEFKALSFLLEMKVGYLASGERWAGIDTHLDYGRGLARAVGRLYGVIK